jgi:hypothetical protein
MHPDIPEVQCAKQSITNRMDQHIRIAMPKRPATERDGHTPQPELPALRQLMKIYAKSYSVPHINSAFAGLG